MPLNIIHINAGMTLSSLDKVGASLTVNKNLFIKVDIILMFILEYFVDCSSWFFGSNSHSLQKEN